ncbi:MULTISPECIES: hypothetical protein [unclassified Kribbella]|uniref:hypothetical protein n=1 Tax=unclassified Kribbella TaxID=2644121 RepID=UPI0033E7BAC6
MSLHRPASALATAGGSVIGEARTLADALTGRGLECSVRFTAPDGGHSGCFAFQATGRVTSDVVFQYRPDGSVTGLTIKVRGTGETGPALRSLAGTVGEIVFPTDLPRVNNVLRAWGGWVDGSWGNYQIIGRGEKTEVSAAKLNSTQLKVPVLHLDTTESTLADALRADGLSCTADNDTCERKPGLALKFSGPDSGITYLVATAAAPKDFEKVLGHLSGSAVQPVREWTNQHLDGRSHTAYVAGWRVDLKPVGQQVRLTLFNEEVWLVMS